MIVSISFTFHAYTSFIGVAPIQSHASKNVFNERKKNQQSLDAIEYNLADVSV